MPTDIIIDLSKEYELIGFRYLPDQNYIFPSGTISHYEFYVSNDQSQSTLTSSGEFSNIKNNPLWRTIHFDIIKGRYIKLRALKNTQDNKVAGYAEIDILTK